MNTLPLMFVSMPGPLEIALILLVILLLFGAKRLPETARSLGQAIREFKESLMGRSDRDEPPKNKS